MRRAAASSSRGSWCVALAFAVVAFAVGVNVGRLSRSVGALPKATACPSLPPPQQEEEKQPLVAARPEAPSTTNAAAAAACLESVQGHYLAYAARAATGSAQRERHGALRIAAFSRLWVPPLHGNGGMQFHALHLYSQLAARGHSVRVFVTGPPSPASARRTLHYDVDPVTLHPVEAKDAGAARLVVEQVASARNGEYSEEYFASAIAAFRAANATQRFDVAHSESWAGVPLVHDLAGLSMLVTWHGSMLDWFRNEINLIVHNYRMRGKMPGPHTASRMKSLGASVAFESYMLLSVPHHVVISDSAAKDLHEINLIDRSRIHLIYNGVNPHNFRPLPNASVRAAFLAAHGVAESEFVVGCGGRLEGIKGHHQLALAMRRVLARHKTMTLLVAGSGVEGARYEAMRSEGFKVVLLGMLPQGQLAAFYQSLDVFVDPFYQHHGLNTVMLEAVLCGVPIVATALASAATTAPCSEFGRTFPLGDVDALAAQVEHFATHEQERRLVGRNVRERALRLFSSEVMAGSYEALLYDAIHSSSSSNGPLEQPAGKIACVHTYPAMCYREP